MPNRQMTKRIVTPPEIMGEDAFVIIKAITMDEAKDLRHRSVAIDDSTKVERDETIKAYADKNNLDPKSLTDEQLALAIYGTPVYEKIEAFRRGFYADFVLDWNWVTENNDDNGNAIPMAKPHHNPAVFSTLTAQEFQYIASLFEVSETTEKK